MDDPGQRPVCEHGTQNRRGEYRIFPRHFPPAREAALAAIPLRHRLARQRRFPQTGAERQVAGVLRCTEIQLLRACASRFLSRKIDLVMRPLLVCISRILAHAAPASHAGALQPFSALLLRRGAAVDDQLTPCHIRGFVGGKVQDPIRYVFRGGRTPHGQASQALRPEVRVF